MIAIIVLLAGCVEQSTKDNNSQTKDNNSSEEKQMESQLLEIANQNQNVKDYIIGQGFQAKTMKLSQELIEAQKQKNPIYQGLPTNTELFEIDYFSPEKGSFVAIIDWQNKTLIKFYRTAGISIGGS
jgi:hypothetical protein